VQFDVYSVHIVSFGHSEEEDNAGDHDQSDPSALDELGTDDDRERDTTRRPRQRRKASARTDPTADERQYYIQGEGRMTVFAAEQKARTLRLPRQTKRRGRTNGG
jgi:hypothetical protein